MLEKKRKAESGKWKAESEKLKGEIRLKAVRLKAEGSREAGGDRGERDET